MPQLDAMRPSLFDNLSTRPDSSKAALPSTGPTRSTRGYWPLLLTALTAAAIAALVAPPGQQKGSPGVVTELSEPLGDLWPRGQASVSVDTQAGREVLGEMTLRRPTPSRRSEPSSRSSRRTLPLIEPPIARPAPTPVAAPVTDSALPETEATPRPVLAPENDPIPGDVANDFTPATKVYSPAPDYPEPARLAMEKGTVVLAADVNEAGAVTATRVLRSVSPDLDAAASTALQSWLFKPATRDGEPVADVYRTAITYRLEPPAKSPEEPDVAQAKETSGPTLRPVRLYTPPPSYPQPEWVAGHAGKVRVRATVGLEGYVTGTEIIEGVSPGLDNAVLAAVGKWRFRPALRGGQPVIADEILTFRFER